MNEKQVPTSQLLVNFCEETYFKYFAVITCTRLKTSAYNIKPEANNENYSYKLVNFNFILWKIYFWDFFCISEAELCELTNNFCKN